MILINIAAPADFGYNAIGSSGSPFQSVVSKMQIHQLKQKERAQVLGYHKGDPVYRRKLLEMGLIPGVNFLLVQIAPLGDPIQIELRGYTLSLRKDEAAILKIGRVE